jgi:hypothetical protein
MRHSKLASGSFEAKPNVATGDGVTASGAIGIVVFGATVASPAAIANGERLSASPHSVPAASFAVSEMSTHSVPLWCRSRAGSV